MKMFGHKAVDQVALYFRVENIWLLLQESERVWLPTPQELEDCNSSVV